MEFTAEEIKCQKEAEGYIRANKDKLIYKFILDKKPIHLGFITIFMAGSPGSGKTEFSQKYLPILYKNIPDNVKNFLTEKNFIFESIDTFFVRIDVDEIRTFLPQYRQTDRESGIKGNAHIVQKAANKGLDILRNYCLENEISFLHDGTFGNYKTMKKIIKKSLKNNRRIQIYYLYLDPLSAWEFTKAREYLEGRNILKNKFIEQFFSAQDNLDKIKQEFKSEVIINCVLKKSDNTVKEIELNVPNIKQYLETQYKKGIILHYSPKELARILN